MIKMEPLVVPLPKIQKIPTLQTLTPSYNAIICDVWGVIHDGVTVFENSLHALRQAKQDGVSVVLVTNAPRPHSLVEEQLHDFGVGADVFDCVVTSGDVTRALIKEAPRKIFHLGPDRDVALFDGIDVELVADFEAQAIVCTGLFNDHGESPEDYKEMLMQFRARDLPFICANPDIVIERGDQTVWCAGALAREYTLLGGRGQIAGKPHNPIYREAIKKLESVVNKSFEVKEILAIGDGIMTDIKGAVDYGLDALFISGGIHFREYGDTPSTPQSEPLHQFLNKHALYPVATMAHLR